MLISALQENVTQADLLETFLIVGIKILRKFNTFSQTNICHMTG